MSNGNRFKPNSLAFFLSQKRKEETKNYDSPVYRALLNAGNTRPLTGFASLLAAKPQPPKAEESGLYKALLGIKEEPTLEGLAALYAAKPTPAAPPPVRLNPLPKIPSPLSGISRLSAPLPLPEKPKLGAEYVQSLVRSYLRHKPEVKLGRVLPQLEDLTVLEARTIKAAFVYTDLNGFTKLVASQPTDVSFKLLQILWALTAQVTKYYGGEVVESAGDRIMSVFWRPSGDNTPDPIHDAVKAALWLQTMMQTVVGPIFTEAGVPGVGVTIGIDYGQVSAGCVGSSHNKKLIFLGDAANNAAKLQDGGGPGETILSPIVYAKRPDYLVEANSWHFQHDYDSSGRERFRTTTIFKETNRPCKR